MKSRVESLPSFLKNDKVIKIIIGVGLAIILIIFLSDLFAKEESDVISEAIIVENQTDYYEKQLEEKLIKVLSKIDNVGEISVMVTLDSAREYIFAEELNQSADNKEEYDNGDKKSVDISTKNENSYILVDGGQGRKEALIKTVIEPKIRGVIVVCDGGENPVIKEKIVEAVSKIFNITSVKICVTK